MQIGKKKQKSDEYVFESVYIILALDTRRQPGETQDPMTRTSQAAKKVRANEATHKLPRLPESI